MISGIIICRKVVIKMTSENLKKEFEIRRLKALTNELRMKLNIANQQLNARVIKEVEQTTYNYKKENIKLKRLLSIAEDMEQRLEKKVLVQNKIIDEKDALISALKSKILEQAKEIDKIKGERDKCQATLNLDGKTSGLPTSKTPLNKKKTIPNTREKSGKNIGGQFGHKKHKLEKFKDEEINETEEIIPSECPKCHSKNLIVLDTETTKDELDYEIKVIKKRYQFKNCECEECHNIFREAIPIRLKEENQYGNKVQAHALSLMNIGNVPINKVRRILSGLTSDEINLSEGYISKLQKRASKLLEEFTRDLKKHICKLDVVHWDDTVIFINGKRACLRGYCNQDVIIYTAHERKNKEGLDEDNILNQLSENVKVVHDHNKVNYNKDYIYVNVECCIHLERDLEKVKLNIPESTWSKKLKELFSNYNQKRNEYLKKNIESFSFEETNEFMIKFDESILLGMEENKHHGKSYYLKDERALLFRLMEYRDNYTYWLYDFSIPYTNNEAERSLRGVKTKMKVSGQFQIVENARYYASIKSYVETCHRNGINETEALIKLLNGTPYTIDEIIEIGLKNKEKKQK